jgi:hypothetical protein
MLGKTIVFVEDNPDNRTIYSLVLEHVPGGRRPRPRGLRSWFLAEYGRDGPP